MFYILLGYFLLCVTLTFTPAFAISPALLLTPHLNQNHTKEARELSVVNPALFLNVTSHSGFLTVDEEYGSNTFFWYFPVAAKPVNETPWIIWLQGGPGASSLDGLFLEMGPFEYDGQLKLRKWSWCKDYSMLFLDNPVGAGFSFTNSEKGFVRDMATYSEHLYRALQQFVTIFPELKKAPLYVAGESYAGRYVPAFGERILQNNTESGIFSVNLQGLIMGNPVMRRDSIANYTSLFYQWGLIDSQGALAAKDLQDRYSNALGRGDVQTASDLHNQLLDKLQNIALQRQLFNVLVEDYKDMSKFEEFLQREDIREALHVGDISFSFSNGTVHTNLIPDFLSEVETKVESFLEHHRILIYCGQLDLTAPCTMTAEGRRKNWHWSRREEFLQAPRQPWWDDESVAGYVKSGGGFTEALVKGAGHLVPMDKPAQIQQLVKYFIQNWDMPLPPNYHPDPADTPEYSDTQEGSKTQECGAKGSISGVLTASVVANVILVLVVGWLGVVYYVKRRRREAFFYSSVDNISDDIFLS